MKHISMIVRDDDPGIFWFWMWRHVIRMVAAFICSIIIANVLFSQPVGKETTLTIGILEDHSNDPEGPRKFMVRVVFKKVAGHWESFPNNIKDSKELVDLVKVYPERLSWNICFDGRRIGALNSTRPQRFPFYKSIGLQNIEEHTTIPKIGKPSLRFTGWLVGEGKLIYRPLLLSSSSNCSDPQSWKPYSPTEYDLSSIIACLRKRFGVGKTSSVQARPTINRSYVNRLGEKLISLSLTAEKWIPYAEGGLEDNDPNYDLWCYVSKDDTRYIDSNMLLIDVGDYDNDGKIEAIFKLERYDYDAYRLYYDGFNQFVEYGWIYH